MRPASLAVLALLLVATAAGQGVDPVVNGETVDEVVDVRVTMHSGDGDHWFECAGPTCNEGKNPAMVLEPGREYRFHVTNEADVQHDLHVGGTDAETRLLDPGENVTMRFTVPEDAEGDDPYWCSVHPQMRGTVVFETPAVGGGPIDNDTPGVGTLLSGVALGAALLLVDRNRRWVRRR